MAAAAAVTTLDGWDAVVFSGGIGRHSAELRERVCARLVPLRPRPGGVPSERLAAAGVRVLAVPVDEEAVMDRLARGVVRARRSGPSGPGPGTNGPGDGGPAAATLAR
jgi:acetate kinase